MRLLLFICFLFPAFTLTAQLFGPVARPVAVKERNLPWLIMEVTGGTNLVVRRSLLTNFATREGLGVRPGVQLGLNAVFSPAAPTNLILGANLVLDRGVLTGYRKSVAAADPAGGEMTTPIRERVGNVDINELWYRGHLGIRISIGSKMKGLIAFQASGLLSGQQRYGYTQTTTAFFEPITQRVIPLEEPLVSTGSREFIGRARGGYSGAIFGLSYPVNERLRLAVDFEQGWHLASAYESAEWRQRRSRLGISLVYGLTGLTRH